MMSVDLYENVEFITKMKMLKVPNLLAPIHIVQLLKNSQELLNPCVSLKLAAESLPIPVLKLTTNNDMPEAELEFWTNSLMQMLVVDGGMGTIMEENNKYVKDLPLIKAAIK